MVRYLARRVLIFVPSLMLVSILTFVMVRTAGGDPASLKLGLHASPESLARLRREMGLTDPWPVQYGHWFADAVRGDLGRSYLTGSRVTYEILNRFPATLELALASMLIAVPLGIAVGTVSAVRPRTLVDHLSMLGGLFGISIPTFWLGVMLIIVFAVWLGVVPVAGSNDVHMGVYPITGLSLVDGFIEDGGPGLWDALRHLILPAATLAGLKPSSVAFFQR